jgi:hypothetical protein
MRSCALIFTLGDANFNSFRFFLVSTIHASVIFNNDPPLGHETRSWKCLRSYEPHVFTPTERAPLEQLIVTLKFSQSISRVNVELKTSVSDTSSLQHQDRLWRLTAYC